MVGGRWCIVILHPVLNLEKITLLKLTRTINPLQYDYLSLFSSDQDLCIFHSIPIGFGSKLSCSLQNCSNGVPFWIYLVGNRGGNKLDSNGFHMREWEKSHQTKNSLNGAVIFWPNALGPSPNGVPGFSVYKNSGIFAHEIPGPFATVRTHLKTHNGEKQIKCEWIWIVIQMPLMQRIKHWCHL